MHAIELSLAFLETREVSIVKEKLMEKNVSKANNMLVHNKTTKKRIEQIIKLFRWKYQFQA